eukprot:TRINITY_DN10763_c0_g1_i1.p1 TRINITY_DN10763_c0_g1~~TRINITY_DN10763_c0_g1_i1.p1  ORF type:complete len:565 (+),score=131.28 TRINITY_DN10763_c0_g1_i1:79-1695(+)
MYGRSRQESRKAEFKSNGVDTRRRRDERNTGIRKARRNDTLMKARRLVSSNDAHSTTNSAITKEAESKIDPSTFNTQIPELVKAMYNTTDAAIVLAATTELRKILSIESNPPIDTVINSGAVPKLIEFLNMDSNEKIQFEAAWAVTNIASGNQAQTATVIQAGCVPLFVRLMSSSNPEIVEQAMWALGNIAGDSTDCRDYVLKEGAMPPLLEAIRTHDKITFLRNATWALSNFCRGKPMPAWSIVRPALPVLKELVNCEDTEIITDALWALSYLSDGENEKIDDVLATGIAPRLVSLVGHKAVKVITPALRTFGNIVTGTDSQTEAMIAAGVIPALRELLSHSKSGVQKEACWTLSNITAGTRQQIQYVIDAHILPVLLKLLANATFDVRKEAGWAIANLCSGGNHNQIATLVQCGGIPPLCALLGQVDPQVITIALDALDSVLATGDEFKSKNNDMNPFCDMIEECEGIDLLEELQRHQNEDIYDKSSKLLVDYFQAEEDEDDQNLAPNSGFGFEFGAQHNVSSVVPQNTAPVAFSF